MRLLICGGRHFDDADVIHRELARVHARQSISALIHGSATGLGVAAELWARLTPS
jgi:hypothetical protein